MTHELKLSRAALEALHTLFQWQVEAADECTAALLCEALPDSGGHDLETRHAAWVELGEAIAAARPTVAGA